MKTLSKESNDLLLPKITVCVAAYNVKPYLSECLDSLATQSLREVEFIIVDDGSTDGSGSICDAYAQNDPRFYVIHHAENQGLMLARKTGINQAKGEYLIFLDGDDRLSSANALSLLAHHLEIEKVDVMRFCVECFGDDGKAVQTVQEGLRYRPVDEKNGTLPVLRMIFEKKIMLWTVWTQAYRTVIAKRAAQFCPNENQTMAEDAFWSFILISLAKSFKWKQTDPIYSYRIGSGITKPNNTLATFDQLSGGYRVADWMKDFVDSMQLGKVYMSLVDKTRKALILAGARCFISLPKDERSRGFELLTRWGYHAEIYEAIQQARMDGFNSRKLYTFKAFRLWALGRIAFSRDARHDYRAQFIQLII